MRCVKSYGTFSIPELPGNNAMCSWKDKEGYLYVALMSDESKSDEGVVYKNGGIAIISPDGKVRTLDGKSRPFYPGATILHAQGDDEGKIYISTKDKGLVIIDTKKTPMDPSDDTARRYSLYGVFDTTKGGEEKLVSRSPCLGCDLVTYSWMEPETKDLYICAGSYDTYEGGLTVLQWDEEKKDYTKSYTYRAFNRLLKWSKERIYQHALFETTNAFREDLNEPRGGKFIKRLKMFGRNHNCRRVWKDVKSGLVYVCCEDTVEADRKALPGHNRDGGLTIIDTKKTRDPKDDTVTAINPWTRPPLCGTHVTHFMLDETTGRKFVSMMDLNPAFEEEMSGVTVLTGDKESITFRRFGLYDTTLDRSGELKDAKANLASAQVYVTLRDPKSGEILVFHTKGMDVISKDLKEVSQVNLDKFLDLPRELNNVFLVSDGWIDEKGLIYLSLGEFGNGLLVFRREPAAP